MFRFTIRDVLWLTVVVALAVGWLADRVVAHRSVAEARREAERMKSEAEYANIKFGVMIETVERAGWTAKLGPDGNLYLLKP